jgi:hypothetical protein
MTTVGTVTTMPDSRESVEMLAVLNNEFTLRVDGVHGDGNVTFVVEDGEE